LQAKDRQIEEQIHKRIEVQCQLDAIKVERTQEVWLLKEEIENLEEKKRSQAKAHRCNFLPSTLPSLMQSSSSL
jgi:hypothetical protein